MALSKAAQKKLMQALKFSDEDIAAAVDTDTDSEVEVPAGLKVYDEEGYNTLIENTKTSVKAGYHRAGGEMLLKDLKIKHGIEIEGKDPDKILEAYAAKKIEEAGIKPNEAAQQWAQEKTALQQSINEWKEKASQHEKDKAQIAQEKEWFVKFPQNRSTSTSDEDRMLLLKNKLSVAEDGTISYKGQPLKDDMQNNLGIDKAMEHVFKAENWLAEEGQPAQGRGGSSSKVTVGKPTKKSEVEKQWTDEGKQPMGAEYQAHLTSLLKENPQFDLNG